VQVSPGRKPWVHSPKTTEPCKGDADCVDLTGLNLRRGFRPRARALGFPAPPFQGFLWGNSAPYRLAAISKSVDLAGSAELFRFSPPEAVVYPNGINLGC
jgi:hypothetical protein